MAKDCLDSSLVGEHESPVSGQLVVKRKAGASIVRFKSLFSHDASSIYIIWKNNIRDYSTKTGQLVRTFYSSSDNPLVHLSHHPDHTNRIYACTSNGELICWDEESGLCIECKQIEGIDASESRLIAFHFRLNKVVYVCLQKNGSNTYSFLSLKLSKSKNVKSLPIKMDCSEGQHTFSFGGRNHTEFLACIKRTKLLVLELESGRIFKHKVDKLRPFTCVASHPTEMCIATGDTSGRILIWRDFVSYPATYSINHWHTLPVNDLAFTQAGSHMYSGASENVLVKWMLDMESKVFLPRLSAPIQHIVVAPDNMFVAVATEENAIVLVDSRTKIVQTIQHLSLSAGLGTKPEQRALCTAGMVLEPSSKALVLNSRPGYLQFLSVESQDLMFKLDVVGQNLASQERCKVIVNTDVTHVAVSPNGHWLATVEERDDSDSHREIRLKFWKSHWLETFRLHTNIEIPHQGALLAIEFQPGLAEGEMPRAISSGSDHKFKVWTLLDLTMKKVDEESSGSWGCEGVGTHQGLQAGPLAFSSDGSLLAAGFEHSITLWVPESTQLDASLTHPETREHIKHLQFGKAQCCHLIVAASDNQLFVWNLLNLTLSWTVNLSVTCLASNPLNDYMAAFTEDHHLFVFKPSEVVPVFSQQLNQPSKVVAAVFWPYSARRPKRCIWQQQTQLLFLTEQQELLGLDETAEDLQEGEEVEEESELLPPGSLAPHYATPFSALMAQEAKSNVQLTKPAQIWEQQLKASQGSYAHMLCHTPAHMLPPMELIVKDFVKEYLDEQSIKVDDLEETNPDTKRWQPISKQSSTPSIKTMKKEKTLKKVLDEDMTWVHQMLDLVADPE